MDDRRKPVQYRELLRALISERVEFIVVGGVAAVLEGVPVSTFDLDVVYSLRETNLDRLARALHELDAIYVDPGGRKISPTTDRLRGGGHHLLRTRFGRLDVLGSVGEGVGFDELLPDSRPRSIHGLTVSVLTLEALIAIKQGANRPKDRAVLDLLRQTLAEREGNNNTR
jgi:predicted nucleotidyltransferase